MPSNRNKRANYVLREGFLDEQKRESCEQIPIDCIVTRPVFQGHEKIFKVYCDGEYYGFTVFEIDERENGKELVSLYSIQERGEKTLNFTDAIIPKLEEIAKEYGCKTIRLNTMRTGLVKKLLEKHEWFVGEIIVRKEV